jgi:NAD+-dependent secondary alcohol dehydrogenase Adh1
MKAVRLHAYDEHPRIDDVPEPKVEGPFDVIVRIGTHAITNIHDFMFAFGDRSRGPRRT